MKYSLPFGKNFFVGPFFHNCVLSFAFVESLATGLTEVPMIDIILVPVVNILLSSVKLKFW